MGHGPIVGIDIGGTKMLAVAVDVDDPSTVLARHVVATPATADGVLDAVIECARAVGVEQRVGIGLAGLVDVDGVAAGSWSLAGLVAEPAATVPRDDSGRDAASCDTGPVLHAIRPAPSAPTRREA